MLFAIGLFSISVFFCGDTSENKHKSPDYFAQTKVKLEDLVLGFKSITPAKTGKMKIHLVLKRLKTGKPYIFPKFYCPARFTMYSKASD